MVGPFPLADHRLPAANPAGLVSENEIGTHPCRMDLKSLRQPSINRSVTAAGEFLGASSPRPSAGGSPFPTSSRFSIPTGLCPPAQGCDVPRRSSERRREPPWALRRNPFGIHLFRSRDVGKAKPAGEGRNRTLQPNSGQFFRLRSVRRLNAETQRDGAATTTRNQRNRRDAMAAEKRLRLEISALP